MEEIKFKFVLEDKSTGENVLSEPYMLDSIMNSACFIEQLHEDLERNHGCDGNCANESVNFCECGAIFDNFETTEKLQYTGLKDKNGKEIYEGDILFSQSTVDGEKWLVKFEKCEFHLVIRNSSCSLIFYASLSEVIGNIHENPELLTKP